MDKLLVCARQGMGRVDPQTLYGLLIPELESYGVQEPEFVARVLAAARAGLVLLRRDGEAPGFWSGKMGVTDISL